MRGLVVVGLLSLAILLLAHFGTAKKPVEEKVDIYPVITCGLEGNGIVVNVKANTPLDSVIVEGCKRDEVPAGWTMSCYVEGVREKVLVNYRVGNSSFSQWVTCR